jgi:hypothetical protein
LVLGASKPLIDDDHATLGGPIGERRAEREADHLLRGALGVAARLRPKGDSTAAEVRGADRALAGVAGALLTVGLGATTGDLAAGLRALGARPASGELGGDDLVHDRHVRLDAEVGLVELHLSGVATGDLLHCDLSHVRNPSPRP